MHCPLQALADIEEAALEGVILNSIESLNHFLAVAAIY
jgi:hypothetical protein